MKGVTTARTLWEGVALSGTRGSAGLVHGVCGASRCLLSLLVVQEERQEKLMRDKLQPSKRKSWVITGAQLDEEIGQADQHMDVSLLVEDSALTDQAEQVDEHSVIRLLVEVCAAAFMVFIKHGEEGFEYLHEELLFPNTLIRSSSY